MFEFFKKHTSENEKEQLRNLAENSDIVPEDSNSELAFTKELSPDIALHSEEQLLTKINKESQAIEDDEFGRFDNVDVHEYNGLLTAYKQVQQRLAEMEVEEKKHFIEHGGYSDDDPAINAKIEQIQKDRAMLEEIDQELKKMVPPLTQEQLESIKSRTKTIYQRWFGTESTNNSLKDIFLN